MRNKHFTSRKKHSLGELTGASINMHVYECSSMQHVHKYIDIMSLSPYLEDQQSCKVLLPRIIWKLQQTKRGKKKCNQASSCDETLQGKFGLISRRGVSPNWLLH